MWYIYIYITYILGIYLIHYTDIWYIYIYTTYIFSWSIFGSPQKVIIFYWSAGDFPSQETEGANQNLPSDFGLTPCSDHPNIVYIQSNTSTLLDYSKTMQIHIYIYMCIYVNIYIYIHISKDEHVCMKANMLHSELTEQMTRWKRMVYHPLWQNHVNVYMKLSSVNLWSVLDNIHGNGSCQQNISRYMFLPPGWKPHQLFDRFWKHTFFILYMQIVHYSTGLGGWGC